jgi:hypothetical protein
MAAMPAVVRCSRHLCLVIALAGCATAPRTEVRAFSDSTEAVNVAATPIFDDLAIVERRVGVAVADSSARTGLPTGCNATWIGDRRGDGIASAYCISNAGLYAEIGDPPRTAKLRAGLATLLSFSTALAVLTDNGNLADAQAEIGALTGDLSVLLTVAGPQGAAAGAALPAVAGALQPVLDQLLKSDNANRSRQIILDHNTEVDKLVVALRDAIPAMYGLLIADLAVTINGPPPLAKPLQAQRFAAMRAQRARLDELAMLLDRADLAWQSAYLAASTQSMLSLQLLASSADAVRVDLEAIRRARAAARNPPP